MIRGYLIGAPTVSYTHLDVYKRQQKGFVFIDEADDDLEEAEKAERASIRRYMATGSDLLTTEAGFYTSWHSPSSLYQNPQLSQRTETLVGAAAESLFFPAYESALVSASVGSAIEPGSAGNFSHCNGADGEKDAWRIYDHRTEGEVHINKKDLDLKKGENESYNALGDSQLSLIHIFIRKRAKFWKELP